MCGVALGVVCGCELWVVGGEFFCVVGDVGVECEL